MGCGQSKIHLYPRKSKSKANGKKSGHSKYIKLEQTKFTVHNIFLWYLRGMEYGFGTSTFRIFREGGWGLRAINAFFIAPNGHTCFLSSEDIPTL